MSVEQRSQDRKQLKSLTNTLLIPVLRTKARVIYYSPFTLPQPLDSIHCFFQQGSAKAHDKTNT